MNDLTKLIKITQEYQKLLKKGEVVYMFGREWYLQSTIQTTLSDIGYSFFVQFGGLIIGRNPDGEFCVIDITKRRVNISICQSVGEFYHQFHDLYRADETINF
jgi:hypothetical protein